VWQDNKRPTSPILLIRKNSENEIHRKVQKGSAALKFLAGRTLGETYSEDSSGRDSRIRGLTTSKKDV